MIPREREGLSSTETSLSSMNLDGETSALISDSTEAENE